MLLSSILGNSQRLDGGAMFGNAPKALWQRWIDADDRNRINLSTRALLVETDDQKILFETGIGAYMEPKFRDRYGIQEAHHVLLENLNALGLNHEDITHVVLSHLHFDHAGGMLSVWEENTEPELLFPNAQIYVGNAHWERAKNPHSRDRASFEPKLMKLLEESKRLNLINSDDCLEFGELKVHFFVSSGHTPDMLCSDLRWQDQRLVFAADLIPGKPWVHLPITMGYDRFPELLIDEKKQLLTSLEQDNGWLFFTHDNELAAAKVSFDSIKKRFGTSLDHQSLTRVPSI